MGYRDKNSNIHKENHGKEESNTNPANAANSLPNSQKEEKKINPLSIGRDEDLMYQDVSNIENQKEDFEWVSNLYERLQESLLLGKEPLEKFLKSFEQYKDHLQIIPEQYVKKFEEDGDPNLVFKIRDDIIQK